MEEYASRSLGQPATSQSHPLDQAGGSNRAVRAVTRAIRGRGKREKENNFVLFS